MNWILLPIRRYPRYLAHNLVYLPIAACLYDGILTGYERQWCSGELAKDHREWVLRMAAAGHRAMTIWKMMMTCWEVEGRH
jgi:hypothetical protein